jgi:hypothetical protein
MDFRGVVAVFRLQAVGAEENGCFGRAVIFLGEQRLLDLHKMGLATREAWSGGVRRPATWRKKRRCVIS